MKNRLDALEGDHLFDELHYGADGKGEEVEISDNSDQQEWQSENASESEDIIDDADSIQKDDKNDKNTPEVDPTDEFWNQNKKTK